MIDGIDRNAVEEEVKAQIDYDCLLSYEDDSVVKMVEEIKDLMVDVLCGERTVISEGKRVSECCLPRKTQKVGNHGISRIKAG